MSSSDIPGNVCASPASAASATRSCWNVQPSTIVKWCCSTSPAAIDAAARAASGPASARIRPRAACPSTPSSRPSARQYHGEACVTPARAAGRRSCDRSRRARCRSVASARCDRQRRVGETCGSRARETPPSRSRSTRQYDEQRATSAPPPYRSVVPREVRGPGDFGDKALRPAFAGTTAKHGGFVSDMLPELSVTRVHVRDQLLRHARRRARAAAPAPSRASRRARARAIESATMPAPARKRIMSLLDRKRADQDVEIEIAIAIQDSRASPYTRRGRRLRARR